MAEQSTTAAEWAPEVLVRVYRGNHLIEQHFCETPESAAEVIESLEANPPSTGQMIVVEPHPPEGIVSLLRAIADAIDQHRPVPMRHPLPHIRLQLATERTEPGRSRHGELRRLWQELAHPGG